MVIYFLLFLTLCSTIFQSIKSNKNCVNYTELKQLTKFLQMWHIFKSKCLQLQNIIQKAILRHVVQSKFFYAQYFGCLFLWHLVLFSSYFLTKKYSLLILIIVVFKHKKFWFLKIFYKIVSINQDIVIFNFLENNVYFSLVEIETIFNCISSIIRNLKILKKLQIKKILIKCMKHFNLNLQCAKTLSKSNENIPAHLTISLSSICLKLYYMAFKVRNNINTFYFFRKNKTLELRKSYLCVYLCLNLDRIVIPPSIEFRFILF